jgi:hypothetical protein
LPYNKAELTVSSSPRISTPPPPSIAIFFFQVSPYNFAIMVNPSARYNFFRPELRDAAYANGDVYSKEKVEEAQAQWNIST